MVLQCLEFQTEVLSGLVSEDDGGRRSPHYIYLIFHGFNSLSIQQLRIQEMEILHQDSVSQLRQAPCIITPIPVLTKQCKNNIISFSIIIKITKNSWRKACCQVFLVLTNQIFPSSILLMPDRSVLNAIIKPTNTEELINRECEVTRCPITFQLCQLFSYAKKSLSTQQSCLELRKYSEPGVISLIKLCEADYISGSRSQQITIIRIIYYNGS